MRFLRLRIANYRGIISSEVKFCPTGITLIQGPNEVGKTSLGEAIGLLFEYPDSSKRRDIEAIKPVHRDEGPEIELQVESGPYAFTYYKRFYKKPETKLTITRPRPENHTGREAHDRADAILRDTLDIDLWRALTIQQGDAINQPILTKQTSLSAALDKAAGGPPADPREEGLFDKVKEEYSRYYTEGGAEKKDLKEARRLQTDTEREIDAIAQQINDLEQDIERFGTLQRELGQLKKQEEDLEKAVKAHTEALQEIVALETALATARLELESAQKSEQAARREKEVRKELIDAVVKAAKDYEQLSETSKGSLSSLNSAEEDIKKAQAKFNVADKRKKEADALVALRRADFDYYSNKLHLEQLQERKGRIDQARLNAAKAEVVLAKNKIDSRALKVIQDAERALLTANAQLETGAPSVFLRCLADGDLQIDDENIVLGKGEVRTLSVADRTHITVPEILDIEIAAGSSTEMLSRKVTEAQLALKAACKTRGVSNPDEARKAYDERLEALRNVDNREKVEKDNLRDLTYDQIDKKLISLRHNVSEYLSNRVQEPAICPDLEIARKEWSETEGTQQETNSEWETASLSVEAARDVRDKLSAQHQQAQVKLEMLGKDLNHKRENLERVRRVAPDDTLDANHDEALRNVSSKESRVQSAESSLKVKNPERTKALADTAKGSLKTVQNHRATVQTGLTVVQTSLRIHGEEGLHEKLNMAQSRFEHLEKDNLALFRRAAAAKYLFETIHEERDKARKAYVAPLRGKIEHLGRLIFDDSFQVEVSEDLQIVSRTTGGITVPFDSLSGGTKEQLSLIFRLACSMIVAGDGGTPLILDDALGYTDPERLQLMGAVLARAAKECQIIIFTCAPDRYFNVGEANVIPLK